jgi:hypothetical protein
MFPQWCSAHPPSSELTLGCSLWASMPQESHFSLRLPPNVASSLHSNHSKNFIPSLTLPVWCHFYHVTINITRCFQKEFSTSDCLNKLHRAAFFFIL